MKRRHLIQAAALATSATILSACSAPKSVSNSSSSGQGKATDTFTYAISGDPLSLNPINTSDRWGLTTANIVYSPLAHFNPDGTASNDLAESITQASDGLSVTVKLRKDLKWSDGKPLTADDVVFTYTERAKPENGNSDSLWINKKPITATKVDDSTVRFNLPSYSAAALTKLGFETYIIPKHIYNGKDLSGSQLDPISVGSGPYKLVSYERGQYLKFEANEHYFGEAPKIKNLILKIVSNSDTVKAALQTGEIDASFVTPQQVPDFDKSPITVTPYPEGRVAYVGILTAKVHDINLRKAIFYAINREDILRACWLDPKYYQPVYSILPPSNSYSTSDVEKYDHNLDKARQLLETSGAKDVKLTLGYSGNDAALTTQATLIQKQLAEIGITVELAGMESSAVSAEIRKGKESAYDFFLGGYIMGFDPDSYSVLFRSGARSNYFNYVSKETDGLFDAGTQEKDPSKRKEIYVKLQRQIAEDAIIYPLGDNLKLLAVNNRVDGVKDATPVPIYTLENFGKLYEK